MGRSYEGVSPSQIPPSWSNDARGPDDYRSIDGDYRKDESCCSNGGKDLSALGGTPDVIDVRKTFHCSERCPRIPCKKPLGRRFFSGRVLFWSPLRPCLRQPSSEGNSPSLSSAHRQSVRRSAARRAETFSCATDGDGLDPRNDVSHKVSVDSVDDSAFISCYQGAESSLVSPRYL